MQIFPLKAVECAILHDEYKPLNPAFLYHAAERAMKVLGLGETLDVTSIKDGPQLLLSIDQGKYWMFIVQTSVPAGMDTFETALKSPYTFLSFPDVLQVIGRHRAYTVIMAGKGRKACGPELEQVCRKYNVRPHRESQGLITTSQEAIWVKRLCSMMISYILAISESSAVHWATHDHLLPPDAFRALAESYKGLALDFHPVIFTSAPRLEEGAPIGCIAFNSHYLTGKGVIFDETPAPPEWITHKTLFFLNYCLHMDAVPAHMDTFSTEDEPDVLFGVTHKEPEELHGVGEVHISLLRAPEFGILDTKRMDAFISEDAPERKEPVVAEPEAAEPEPSNAPAFAFGRASSSGIAPASPPPPPGAAQRQPEARREGMPQLLFSKAAGEIIH